MHLCDIVWVCILYLVCLCNYLLIVLLAITVCLCLYLPTCVCIRTLLDCGGLVVVGLFGPRAVVD